MSWYELDDFDRDEIEQARAEDFADRLDSLDPAERASYNQAAAQRAAYRLAKSKREAAMRKRSRPVDEYDD